MTPSRQEVIHTYRQLFKHLLRAVQYSKPARYVVQDRIGNAFRNFPPSEYDASRISRTLEFLDGAAKSKGLEHKILKNLMHVWWEQRKLMQSQPRANVLPFRRKAYEEFNRSVERLNESMGLCIK